ncbi:MAG: hypothetical protein GC154_05790 [bacterium]|nr:hypothetical protein [bacterium]
MKIVRVLRLAAAALCALGALSIFLWLAGYSPWETARVIAEGSWGTPAGRMQALGKSSILIMTGLAVALPFRAGLFNIGGEGQMLLGGLAAAMVGVAPLAFSGPVHWILCLIAGAAAGAAWAALSGWLREARGVHEVISTILLNFVALHFCNQAVFGWFSAGDGASRTPYILESAVLPALVSAGAARLSWAIVFACAAAIALSIWLLFTRPGFTLLAVGANPDASRNAGIRDGRVRVAAMALGGACAGLAGAFETCGLSRAFFARFGGGMGFDGVAAAFLALTEPWAVIPSALTMSSLRTADRTLQLEIGLPKEAVFIMEGVLLLSIAVFFRRRVRAE